MAVWRFGGSRFGKGTKGHDLSLAGYLFLLLLLAGGCSSSPPVAPRKEVSKKPSTTPPIRQEKTPRTPAREDAFPELKSYRFSNGLRLLVREDRRLPIVSLTVAYRVGPAWEAPDRAGVSHLLSHLTSLETKGFRADEIQEITYRAGGATRVVRTADLTIYGSEFGSDRLPAFLRIEADRMRRATLAPAALEEARKSVLREIQGADAGGWASLRQAAEAALFTERARENPEAIRGLSSEGVAAFYGDFYRPDNAVLVVVGDVAAAECRDLVQEAFGSFPEGEVPLERRNSPDPRPERIRIIREGGRSRPRLLMGFRVSGITPPEEPSFEALSLHLTFGPSSLIPRRIARRDFLARPGAIASGFEEGGLFRIEVELLEGSDPKEVEIGIREELERARRGRCSEEELRRVRNALLARYYSRQEHASESGARFARAEASGRLTLFRSYPSRLRELKAEDLRRAADRLWSAARQVVLVANPKVANGKRDGEPAVSRCSLTPEEKRSLFRGDPLWFPDPGAFEERRLSNGMILLAKRVASVPTLVVRAYAGGSNPFDPPGKAGLGALVGRLLHEGFYDMTGRRRMDATGLREALEATGGELRTSSNGLVLRILKAHAEIAYDLIRDLIRYAALPKDRFERVRDAMMARQEDETDALRIAGRLFDETVYRGHPLQFPSGGTRRTLEAIRREDVARFYRERYRPGNMIVAVVGDVDPRGALEALERRFADWRTQGDVSPASIPEAKRQEEPRFGHRFRGRESVQVWMGHATVPRNHAHYLSLRLLEEALFGGPGPFGRLARQIEVEEGLASGVRGAFAHRATNLRGAWVVRCSTPARNLERVRALLPSRLRAFLEAGPSPRDMEAAREYLIRRPYFLWQGQVEVADALIAVRRYNLARDQARRSLDALRKLTREDLRRAARAEIDLSRSTTILVGPVDKDGRVIPIKDR